MLEKSFPLVILDQTNFVIKHQRSPTSWLGLLCALGVVVGLSHNAHAFVKLQTATNKTSIGQPSPEFKDIGIDEHLGSKVSIQDLEFTDESGRTVKLAEYFKNGKPVILSLAYYECPNLCGFVFTGLMDTYKDLQWKSGEQFEWVNVSINPRETPELAARKKANFAETLKKPGAEKGWHFLTGKEDQIQKLAKEVGFKYRYIEADKEYAHGAALFVLSPTGLISRYLYGIQYPAKNVRLALLEASEGKMGTFIERALLFCYKYDAHARGYTVQVIRLMQFAGVLTILMVAFLIYNLSKYKTPVLKNPKDDGSQIV